MSKIEELKVEAANLFYLREELQYKLNEVNTQLGTVSSAINEEQKKLEEEKIAKETEQEKTKEKGKKEVGNR